MAVQSYDSTTGRPIFNDNDAPDIKVDPTQVGIYAADVGNSIIRVDLAALNAYAYKREGLNGYATSTGISYKYKSGAWVIPARFATWTYTRPSSADATIYEDGTLTAVSGETTNGGFATSVTGSKVTLMPGVYVAVFAVSVGAAVSGRTFLEVAAGARVIRNNPVNGEDQVSVTAQFMLAASTQVSFKVYKQTGGSSTLGGHLTIQKVE